jgi:integrase
MLRRPASMSRSRQRTASTSVGVIKTKGKPAELVEGPTKSGRERVVDLDPQTVEALRRYRVVRAGLSLQLPPRSLSSSEVGHDEPPSINGVSRGRVRRCFIDAIRL